MNTGDCKARHRVAPYADCRKNGGSPMPETTLHC